MSSSISIERTLHSGSKTAYFHLPGAYVTAWSKTEANVGDDGTIYKPAPADSATLAVGPNMANRVEMALDSAGLRSMAEELVRIADRLDTPLRPEVQYRVPTLLTEREGDTYYTGPLPEGKWLAEQERYPVMHLSENGFVHVGLCDDEDRQDEAEYGSGPDEETAWRFALGAMFGPIDDGYNEDWLIAAVARARVALDSAEYTMSID